MAAYSSNSLNMGNLVHTIEASIVSGSASFLQIIRIGIKSCSSSIFSGIESFTQELHALERYKICIYNYNGENVITIATSVFFRLASILQITRTDMKFRSNLIVWRTFISELCLLQ